MVSNGHDSALGNDVTGVPASSPSDRLKLPGMRTCIGMEMQPESLMQAKLRMTFGNFAMRTGQTGTMLEKRARKRTKMVLPLRVWLGGCNGASTELQLVHTLNISEAGARVRGLRTQLHPGQIITLQRGRQKAQFRIQWTKQLRPNEIQAGIESLELQQDGWGLDISG